MTAYICAGGLKELGVRSGSKRHRHFVGFFKPRHLKAGNSASGWVITVLYKHLWKVWMTRPLERLGRKLTVAPFLPHGRGLPCPFKHRHGATLLRLFRETTPFHSSFTTHMGIRRTYSRLTPHGTLLEEWHPEKNTSVSGMVLMLT